MKGPKGFTIATESACLSQLQSIALRFLAEIEGRTVRPPQPETLGRYDLTITTEGGSGAGTLELSSVGKSMTGSFAVTGWQSPTG